MSGTRARSTRTAGATSSSAPSPTKIPSKRLSGSSRCTRRGSRSSPESEQQVGHRGERHFNDSQTTVQLMGCAQSRNRAGSRFPGMQSAPCGRSPGRQFLLGCRGVSVGVKRLLQGLSGLRRHLRKQSKLSEKLHLVEVKAVASHQTIFDANNVAASNSDLLSSSLNALP